jgi:hypothetical protein
MNPIATKKTNYFLVLFFLLFFAAGAQVLTRSVNYLMVGEVDFFCLELCGLDVVRVGCRCVYREGVNNLLQLPHS